MLEAVMILLAAPAVSPQQEAPIVVVGKRLSDTDTALKACIARGCPVAEESAATVAHAENQFVTGDYRAARNTLTAGLRRNRKHAAQAPLAVSALIRAHARVASHLGLFDFFKHGSIDNARMLSKELGEDDPNALVARVEVGDALMLGGQTRAAQDLYDGIADRSRKANKPAFEGYAMLRRASLDLQLQMRPNATPVSRIDSIERLLASDVPEHRPFIEAAAILKAGHAARRGDNRQLDATIARLRATPGNRPTLLFAPAIDLKRLPIKGREAPPTSNVDDNWADIGFWVRPDGRVADAEVLRTGKQFEGEWTTAVIDALTQRRYAPLAIAPTDPGSYRVERYTFTSEYVAVTGSRQRVRSSTAQILRLDLTEDRTAAASGQ